MRTPPASGGQDSEVPGPPFADGELLPRDPGFFPEDEEEAMTLAPPEGPPESDMDSPMESTQSLEGSVGSPPEEKDRGLGGLFLPEDKSLGHAPSMTTSDLSTHSTTSLISNEEQFEDYGEGDDVDCAPSSPCPDDETRTNVYSDLGSSVSSSAGQTPRKMRHTYNSELLDVYCSQCCKKINLLNDLEARLKNLKANSPNRKISSTAFGRQVHQGCPEGPGPANGNWCPAPHPGARSCTSKTLGFPPTKTGHECASLLLVTMLQVKSLQLASQDFQALALGLRIQVLVPSGPGRPRALGAATKHPDLDSGARVEQDRPWVQTLGTDPGYSPAGGGKGEPQRVAAGFAPHPPASLCPFADPPDPLPHTVRGSFPFLGSPEMQQGRFGGGE